MFVFLTEPGRRRRGERGSREKLHRGHCPESTSLSSATATIRSQQPVTKELIFYDN